jgi:hypothetical protein
MKGSIATRQDVATLTMGLRPRQGLARACKGASQKKKPGSEGRCEGMNPHTPKAIPTLGVRVLADS